MESKSDQSPLICIVGETASGKTALAIELARRFNGEIIAADSRTLYQGMDIGTAKPTAEEQAVVPHHLIDVSTPDHPLTAADFQRLANEAIGDISRRGKLAFMVGGTGMYIDAVLFDYSFQRKPDQALRARLQNLTVEELQRELLDRGIPLPENNKNPRHLMRALETEGLTSSRQELRGRTLVLGLEVERQELRARVTARTEAMLNRGLEHEVRTMFGTYGPNCPLLHTIGYQEFLPYMKGEIDLGAVREAIIKNTMQLAKRQRTWFRRNKGIHYIRNKEDAVAIVTTFLNNAAIAN